MLRGPFFSWTQCRSCRCCTVYWCILQSWLLHLLWRIY